MRTSARLAFGLLLPFLAPVAALAGAHAPVAPTIVRPGFAPVASGPKAIRLAPRPPYGPPQTAIYGPPRNYPLHARRHRGQETGFAGWPAVYQPAVEGAPQAQAAPSGDRAPPRPVVVTNYRGAPPLWQGDAGYVAQPVIYDVGTVLRRYPLSGMAPIGK
jgi:hypothetical protein